MNYSSWGGGYSTSKFVKKEEKKTSPVFKIQKHPHELDKLEIVWNLALQSVNQEVVQKAIDFLIKVYFSVDEELHEKKVSIMDDLISRCMQILKDSQKESEIIRVLDIVKSIMIEAEKKGTGEVRPHSALLKGELLERILINNKASNNINQLIMSVYSNCTFWEFKNQVSEKLGLAPKYLRLEKNGKAIKDTENGKTLGELGFQSGEYIVAEKQEVKEVVPTAELVINGKINEKALKIFNEWFDLYSNEDGKMTRETCALFIKGCTGEPATPSDDRITGLFNAYDKNKDGFIEREEFLEFYESSCRTKPGTVRENMAKHNIRADLKKLSEVKDQENFATQDMPRLKISQNNDYFDQLMELLDKGGEISEKAWNMIQMLATSPQIYKRVLKLSSARDAATGKIEWSKFFDSQSVYKLLYTLQIVEAVMEEGEGEGLEQVNVITDSDAKKKIPVAPALPGSEVLPPGQTPKQTNDNQNQSTPVGDGPKMSSDPSIDQPMSASPELSLKRTKSIVKGEDKLKAEWTKMFLVGDGFSYILDVFMKLDINHETQISTATSAQSQTEFELKHITFLLKILRIFIMAAFSTSSSDKEIYAAASSLVRRASSSHDQEMQQVDGHAGEPTTQTEGSRFKQLQVLMAGPIGEDIINKIDYQLLTTKIMTIISQILGKPVMIMEDKLIIENALSLLVGCILHKNELLNGLYDFKSTSIASFEEFVLEGLLLCKQEKIREEFKQSLSCLAKSILNITAVKELPLFFLLRLLSDKFSIISDFPCKQFFELFCDLIDQYFMIRALGSSSQEEVFNAENLLSQIIDKIKDYNKSTKTQGQTTTPALLQQTQSVQKKQSNDEYEGMYIGLVQLAGKIIDNFDISLTERIVEQKQLIDEVFSNFLFASIFQYGQQEKEQANSTAVTKIKPRRLYGEVGLADENAGETLGKKSKDAAYKLLNNLIKKSPLLMNIFLEKSMIPLMSFIRRHDGWNYQPAGSGSTYRQKYCGLKNLGCICYMNSMLQQFFMIPAFRYNLLSVDDGLPEDIKEYKGNQVDDNVLHQLQKIFAHLEQSDRHDYNPFEFCFAFKDLDGQPTNTGEQKDAQEFLNVSFDRIEHMLKPTSRKYLMQSVFGGQTCSQIVCKECGTCKNRIEDFTNLSLTVKDIKSMAESLQKQVEGEMISDFQCEKCNKKVDISKRVLLSASPNVLVVHLQRIIFNFDTFKNDKINSFFEFPYHLDLTPYSFYDVMKRENRLGKDATDEDVDGAEKQEEEDKSSWPQEEDCWEYKLVGVVVHSGSANSGHYWSYINTKRGHAEVDGNDPDWSKTESDPWMEFNDSTVSNFNFEKLKGECFGGEGGQSNDGWGFGGGAYGKSAYMLVYERRIKKPIKILVSEEEAKQAEGSSEEIHFDQEKNEHYKLLDYKGGVEEIAPSKIYRQVYEDNQKYEFDNDVYSPEFFDFVKGILLSIKTTLQQGNPDQELIDQVKEKALFVGRKTAMDLLAKVMQNSQIKGFVEVLIEIMKQDDSLCGAFLKQLWEEDRWNYIMEILLECTDLQARTQIGNLIKFIISSLKKSEKSKLFEIETVTSTDEKGETYTVQQASSICARFILKCLSLLNTQVAKNWARFDSFLEILQVFAIGEEKPQSPNVSPSVQHENGDVAIQDCVSEEDQIGMEFFLKINFVERVCDFMLGKKSPLCQPGEKRIEMGGYYQPNFTPIVKILIKILTTPDLLEKYPLSEQEKKMFLHAELLKTLLISNKQGGKPFGQCLANMCKDNYKLSMKVSKIFIKSISASSHLQDNVKNYLAALKPFLQMNDSLKALKLEWIFGISQVNNSKNFREDKYKYGLDLISRMGDDAYTYVCPIIGAISEDPLLAQLIKSKGKADNLTINCLKEMLNLMSKDEQIARYIYSQGPHTYQLAKFTDWIRSYLEYQRSDIEKSSYVYVKEKYAAVLKCIKYLEIYEEKFQNQFKQEELEAMQKASQDPSFQEDVRKDWFAYQHEEVIPHFPPQIIIGKQVGEDKEFLVYDEDPLVRVTLNEVTCEYNYSNPTEYFNLSIPHIEIRSSNYTTLSYQQFKKNIWEVQQKRNQMEKEEAARALAEEKSKTESEQTNGETRDPQEEEEKEVESAPFDPKTLQVRDWFSCKREGAVLLKVEVYNKSSGKAKVEVKLSHGDLSEGTVPNVRLPLSSIIQSFYRGNDTKLLIHLQKINPEMPWTPIKVSVNSINKEPIKTVNVESQVSSYNTGSGNFDSNPQNEYRIQCYDADNEQSTVVFIPDSSGFCPECTTFNINSTANCEKCGTSFSSINQNYWPQYDS